MNFVFINGGNMEILKIKSSIYLHHHMIKGTEKKYSESATQKSCCDPFNWKFEYENNNNNNNRNNQPYEIFFLFISFKCHILSNH